METQEALHFVVEGSFCSFREPAGAKYQQTYWFPPKTTVVGFLGAALGLSPPELEPLYDKLRIGVVLEAWGGLARDLWGFTKLKGTVKPETAVVIRELIYQPRYALYVAADEAGYLEVLQDALLDPVYPLRFGRGEDLAMLRGRPCVITLYPVEDPPWLRWTLLPFTLNERPCTLEGLDAEPRPRMPPRPSRMPVRFRYAPNWVRQAELAWMTQVFDWGVRPASSDGVWTDGRYAFYLI
jgi:CRISPR-associated Cas5-like protein